AFAHVRVGAEQPEVTTDDADLFPELAADRVRQRLTPLHAAARQVPGVGAIGVADEQDAPAGVDHQAPDPEGGRPPGPPVEAPGAVGYPVESAHPFLRSEGRSGPGFDYCRRVLGTR